MTSRTADNLADVILSSCQEALRGTTADSQEGSDFFHSDSLPSTAGIAGVGSKPSSKPHGEDLLHQKITPAEPSQLSAEAATRREPSQAIEATLQMVSEPIVEGFMTTVDDGAYTPLSEFGEPAESYTTDSLSGVADPADIQIPASRHLVEPDSVSSIGAVVDEATSQAKGFGCDPRQEEAETDNALVGEVIQTCLESASHSLGLNVSACSDGLITKESNMNSRDQPRQSSSQGSVPRTIYSAESVYTVSQPRQQKGQGIQGSSAWVSQSTVVTAAEDQLLADGSLHADEAKDHLPPITANNALGKHTYAEPTDPGIASSQKLPMVGAAALRLPSIQRSNVSFSSPASEHTPTPLSYFRLDLRKASRGTAADSQYSTKRRVGGPPWQQPVNKNNPKQSAQWRELQWRHAFAAGNLAAVPRHNASRPKIGRRSKIPAVMSTLRLYEETVERENLIGRR